ncbi:Low-affinity potassium transport protein [Venturia nashicola]|uniref:Low-affinity potassium transport protein n=1 Tax=Venturia nashicola TaxID=86259 RepID=A0A4Z1P7T0_9PEZI|nr:Low-affinity potassium transport protein [Venturia nashicola]
MKSVALVLALVPFVAASKEAAAACRNIPGDSGWPSEADWKAQLPGSVARGAQKKYLHPDYRIDAKSVDDVIAAVKFASKHNVRLTAIHSGHDGLGRNDAPSGLLIGLENLTGMRVEETFTPSTQGQPKVSPAPAAVAAAPKGGMEGMAGMKRHSPEGGDMAATAALPKAGTPPVTAAPSGKAAYAVTLGAGMTTQDINDKIAAQGIFTNGAEHGEVGVAGGWSQCGGHGPMTTAYGLGSDNVLEFQVVTADGQLKIANEVANPDLYWALRGGCGSTFGIVTQVTVRAYPSPKFTVTKFNINATTDDGIFAPTAYIHSVIPDLIGKGVQGYYLVFPKKFTAIFHTVGTLATADASKKLWEPVLSKVATYPGIQKESAVATYLDYPDYKTYYDATWGAAEGEHKKRSMNDNEMIHDWWTGEYVRRGERHSLRKRHGPGEEKSLPKGNGKVLGDGRLLDKETLQSPKFAAALKAAMPAKGMMRGVLVGGSIIKKSPTETSVHPSWRKSYASIWSDKDVNEIATLAKGMGAYINEASWNASNWQDVFWGSNYPKLSQIKTKYDPNMLFYTTPGINAEQMMANEKGALCSAPETMRKSAILFPPAGDNKNVKTSK